MHKKIIYTNTQGDVCIVTPAPNFVAEFDNEPEALEAVKLSSVPSDASNVHIVDDSEIPTDRHFRNAWEIDPGSKKIVTNMDKAKLVQVEMIASLMVEKSAILERADRIDKLANGGQSNSVSTMDSIDLDATGKSIKAAKTLDNLRKCCPKELM